MAWNGSNVSKNPSNAKPMRGEAAHQPSPGLRNGILAGLLVVIALGALVAFVFRDDSPEAKVVEKEPKPSRIVEAQPTQLKVRPTTNAVAATAEKPTRPILGKTPTGEEYVEMSAKTNGSGVVEELFTLADGTRKRVVTLQSKDTLVFDNDFDLMLGLIGTTPLDQKLPPMPDLGNMEAQFKKAIATPIFIRETDSEQAKAMKQAALDLRQEIADLMREGYTLTQVLSEYESLRTRNVENRHMFQAELNEIYKSGDIEGAREFINKANAVLEEKGVIPLVMPGEGARRRRRQ